MDGETLPAARVADSRQARLLLDVSLRRALTLLMKRAYGTAELARELDLSLQRAHYLIGKLHAAGVAELDSVQPRAGRAVRLYRVAARWFVPFEVTGAETLEIFLADQILPRMQLFVGLTTHQIEATYTHWGYWLEHSGGASSMNLGDPAGRARELFEGDEPFLFNLGTMRLSPLNATALKRRLLAVMEEFQAVEDVGGTAYALGLLFAEGEME